MGQGRWATPKAEDQQTPRKTRELYVNVKRGLIDTQRDRVLKKKKLNIFETI
jgi:hypothetical protein